MTAIIPFTFESSNVRVIERGGEPWFVLADVCAILEVGNSRDAAARLDDDEKGVDTIDTLGGPQSATIINESGLWSVVLTSRKENAKRFKKWLTSEVIPSIRKTGAYGAAAGTPVAPLTGLEYALALVDAERRGEAERAQRLIAQQALGEAQLENKVLTTAIEIIEERNEYETMTPKEFVAHYAGVTGKHTLNYFNFVSWFQSSGPNCFFTFVGTRWDGKYLYRAKSEYNTHFGFKAAPAINRNIPGDRVSTEDDYFMYKKGVKFLVGRINRDTMFAMPIYLSAYQQKRGNVVAIR
jgi:prophage antirepressor-like protein